MQCGRLALGLGLLALAACGPARGVDDHGVRGSGGHPMVELGSQAATVRADVDPGARGDLDALAAGEARGRKAVVLELQGIRFRQQPEHAYEVYLNLPPGTRATHESPYYVGSLGFYGPVGEGPAQTMQYDVTDLARALAARGAWDPGQARVTLRPSMVEMPPGVPPPPPSPPRGSIERVIITAR